MVIGVSDTSDKENRTTAKRESDLLIDSMTTDRIGPHEVLLSIHHKYYTFRGSWKGQPKSW